jgi:tetratricopeptide (TPR) repeat protein
MGRNREFATFAERALDLVGRLTDERDARYVQFKAGCRAAIARFGIGDLIKSRALVQELMDLAVASGSIRALTFAHWALAVIAFNTGDVPRSVTEMKRGRDAATDPFYRGIVESYLGFVLAASGAYGEAKAVIDPALRFAEDRNITALALPHYVSRAVLLLGEGQLSRGMDALKSLAHQARELDSLFEFVARMNEAMIYARIASGESKGSIGLMVRNAGFIVGKARRASQIARDSLAEFSETLPPDLEGFRFGIEFEFAKLLVKRKERDEARRHLEKAIAFLQPLGDSVGMRDARALLATLNSK